MLAQDWLSVYLYFIALYLPRTKTFKRNSNNNCVLDLWLSTNLWNKEQKETSSFNHKYLGIEMSGCAENLYLEGRNFSSMKSLLQGRQTEIKTKTKKANLWKCTMTFSLPSPSFPQLRAAFECLDNLLKSFPYLQNFRGNHTVAVLWMQTLCSVVQQLLRTKIQFSIPGYG